ncbi:hypothetical protein N7462_003127 [Penicillium macrosclerotiorum]|uniref:uncharacterized protein n=1 Tax=Penicillium macrosclerotiorum TaxID=303699 RepID=UPI0025483AE1|nr:uncharacterized protein N7462_003127 [Penicillium macrosclerotiorum]KAJ5688735.1 hypothetical protein N7462_003127 [Penicillium macrosclerotiorum]
MKFWEAQRLRGRVIVCGAWDVLGRAVQPPPTRTLSLAIHLIYDDWSTNRQAGQRLDALNRQTKSKRLQAGSLSLPCYWPAVVANAPELDSKRLSLHLFVRNTPECATCMRHTFIVLACLCLPCACHRPPQELQSSASAGVYLAPRSVPPLRSASLPLGANSANAAFIVLPTNFVVVFGGLVLAPPSNDTREIELSTELPPAKPGILGSEQRGSASMK